MRNKSLAPETRRNQPDRGGGMTVTRLGKMIKIRLIDLGRTQRNLAEALGVDPRYLSKIVRGKVGPGKYVSTLARELEVTEEDLRRCYEKRPVRNESRASIIG